MQQLTRTITTESSWSSKRWRTSSNEWVRFGPILCPHTSATEALGSHTETCPGKNSLSWICLISTGKKPHHYFAFPFICAIVSHDKLFWLHSLPLTSFTANKTHGTKHLLTQLYMESKSSFSVLVKMTANQMHKASFHKLSFPTSWLSLACLD